jgi:HlyD family secretion protein
VQVKIGISDGIDTEVLDGLKEGDRIVIGTNSTSTQTAAPASSPFGGGPRRF